MPARTHDLITKKRILRIIIDKFPEYFMFQLTKGEFANLESQIAISSSGWRAPRKPPLCEPERIAVKIEEDRGIESLKIMELDG